MAIVNPELAIHERLEIVLQAIGKPDECILKERRQYRVLVCYAFNDLSNILQSLLESPDMMSLPLSQSLLVDHLRQLLFAGISNLDNIEDPIISVSLSKRTFVRHARCAIRVFVKRTLYTLRRDLGRIATFSETMYALSGYQPPTPVGVDGDEFEVFMSELRAILRDSEEISVLESGRHLVFSERWHGGPQAFLKQRFYLSRGDYRAYYVERDVVRHVAGAVLVRILLPKSKRAREKSLFTQAYPIRDKDRLDYQRQLPRDQGCRLLLGDISSFTASAIGAPALAMLMWDLWRVLKKDLPSKLVVSIDGELMEVGVEEVLRTFIRRTVWAPVEIGGETFIATGGYLGLSGNINITLTAFAFLVRVFRDVLRERYPEVRLVFKLGGDDFFALFIGPNGDVDAAVEDFKEFVASFVGQLKFSQSIDPATTTRGVSVGTYCKRQVFAQASCQPSGWFVTIVTHENVPLPSQLFQDFSTMEPLEMRKCGQAFFNSLRQLSARGDILDDLVHSYLYLLEEVQGRPLSITVPRSYCRLPGEVVVEGGLLFTPKAFIRVSSVSSVCTSNGNSVRTSISNKLVLLLSQEEVAMRKVDDGLSSVTLVIHKTESSRFHPDNVDLVERRCPTWDIHRLVAVINKVRSYGIELEY